nr:SMC-Scp complex subunit ScpB [Methylobacterium sp. DB0501]
MIFSAPAPLGQADLAARLPPGTDVPAVLAEIARAYAARGITLVRSAGGYAFRTAPDLAPTLRGAAPEPRKLSRAALETLAIVAYHQPVTRAEIEEIRGVTTSKGSLDLLLETGWVRLRGRRRTPGRPVTYGTTPAFLDHFGLDAVSDLPGLDELKGLGLIEGKLPAGFRVPQPGDGAEADEDPIEDPLEPGDAATD